jgi:hypothetical protein
MLCILQSPRAITVATLAILIVVVVGYYFYAGTRTAAPEPPQTRGATQDAVPFAENSK